MNLITIAIGLVFTTFVSVIYAIGLHGDIKQLEASNEQCQSHIENSIDLIDELGDVGVEQWLRNNDLYRSDPVQTRPDYSRE